MPKCHSAETHQELTVGWFVRQGSSESASVHHPFAAQMPGQDAADDE